VIRGWFHFCNRQGNALRYRCNLAQQNFLRCIGFGNKIELLIGCMHKSFPLARLQRIAPARAIDSMYGIDGETKHFLAAAMLVPKAKFHRRKRFVQAGEGKKIEKNQELYLK
jgi:hypothetical protein